jgi:DNA-binding response OmpR family regulator
MPVIRSLLIVEDQSDLAELVSLHLADVAEQVHVVHDGAAALRHVAADAPDLVVLDLGLPGLDGLEVCRRIRANTRDGRYVPILMLTARSGDADRVLGLEIGADDYLTKPFNVMELVARAKAIVRRMEGLSRSTALPAVHNGRVTIDPASRRVQLDGAELTLTAKEFDLLLHFVRHPGRVFTREQLLDAVWGGAHAGYAHTVNSHINRLRAKIERDPANPALIETVWGVGYRFAEKAA